MKWGDFPHSAATSGYVRWLGFGKLLAQFGIPAQVHPQAHQIHVSHKAVVNLSNVIIGKPSVTVLVTREVYLDRV